MSNVLPCVQNYSGTLFYPPLSQVLLIKKKQINKKKVCLKQQQSSTEIHSNLSHDMMMTHIIIYAVNYECCNEWEKNETRIRGRRGKKSTEKQEKSLLI